jgi:phosphatidylglycerol:prolipoprotein diacylglycerol transferase
MHPILLKIGPITVYSYGTGVILAFVAMMMVSVKRARRFGLQPDRVMNIAIILILLWCVGARLWYAVWQSARGGGHWFVYLNPFDILRHGSCSSGLVEGGGNLLAFLALCLYARFSRVSLITLGNVFLPGLLLATGIWRSVACFLTGCCFGLPTESALGVVYPTYWYLLRPYPVGTPVWPTQLFASAVGFSGFALFYWLERRPRLPGFTLWLTLAYWTLGRIVVDQFRYYPPSAILGKMGPLTFNSNHIVFGAIFLISVASLLRAMLRTRQQRV